MQSYAFRPNFAEFELDSDEIDSESLTHTHEELSSTRSNRRSDQSMPLLVGLLDSSESRRSLEHPLPLHDSDGHVDATLEEIAAKRIAGGGLIDSIANMANSILGAGNAHVMDSFMVVDFFNPL